MFIVVASLSGLCTANIATMERALFASHHFAVPDITSALLACNALLLASLHCMCM